MLKERSLIHVHITFDGEMRCDIAPIGEMPAKGEIRDLKEFLANVDGALGRLCHMRKVISAKVN